MSLSEQKLLYQLRRLGLEEGSGFKNYEGAKKLLQDLNLSPLEYERAIRITTDYLKCSL